MMVMDLKQNQVNEFEYPSNTLEMMDDWIIKAGSFTWQCSPLAGAFYSHYVWQDTTAADKDALLKRLLLESGTYSFGFYYRRGTQRPIVDFSINDDTPFLSVDTYGGAANVQVFGEVVLPYSGWHTLIMTVNGKNASSSDYVLAVEACWLAKKFI